MSTPNAKTPKPQAAQSADQTQDAAPATTGATDPAVVQPTQAPAFEDIHRGQGGVFVIQGGVTQPVEGALAPASPTASKE